MKLNITTSLGAAFELEVENSDDISIVKQKIHQKVPHLRPEYQNLIFRGSKLETGRTLLFYGIVESTTVFLNITLSKIARFELVADRNRLLSTQNEVVDLFLQDQQNNNKKNSSNKDGNENEEETQKKNNIQDPISFSDQVGNILLHSSTGTTTTNSSSSSSTFYFMKRLCSAIIKSDYHNFTRPLIPPIMATHDNNLKTEVVRMTRKLQLSISDDLYNLIKNDSSIRTRFLEVELDLSFGVVETIKKFIQQDSNFLLLSSSVSIFTDFVVSVNLHCYQPCLLLMNLLQKEYINSLMMTLVSLNFQLLPQLKF